MSIKEDCNEFRRNFYRINYPSVARGCIMAEYNRQKGIEL